MSNKPVWKILIVDDDEEDYILTRGMLSQTYAVKVQADWASSFSSGREALRYGQYDAVLMDYDLGQGTGLELIQEAVSRGCLYPMILLTGRGSHEVDVEAMQAGATMYLTKSEVNPLLLERVIRYAIEMKQKEQALKAHEALLKEQNEALAQNSERQALLLEVSRYILTIGPDLPRLTQMIFEKVGKHLQADVCFNYRLESPQGPLHLVAGFGIPAEMWEGSQQLALGQAFCGTVAATARPLVADSQRVLTDEKGAFVRGMGVRAYACHPLFTRDGKVMGTLSLCSTQRNSFSADEINFLQTLCHFLSLAWEQAGVGIADT